VKPLLMALEPDVGKKLAAELGLRNEESQQSLSRSDMGICKARFELKKKPRKKATMIEMGGVKGYGVHFRYRVSSHLTVKREAREHLRESEGLLPFSQESSPTGKGGQG